MTNEEFEKLAKKEYDKKFMEMHRSPEFLWEIPFAEEMVEMFNIPSMLDLGCGVGNFLVGAMNAGCLDVFGYDIAIENAVHCADCSVLDYMKEKDISIPFILPRKFDTVISFEVAEHILPENSDSFVDNLVNHSERLLILTAAPPGQGGHFHINEQPKEFWINKIESKNFKYRPESATNLLKRLTFEIPWWITNNLMVFEKKDGV